MRPNGKRNRFEVVEDVQLGSCDMVRVTAEKRPEWDYPNLYIRLPQGIWMSAGMFRQALRGGCAIVRRDDLQVVAELLGDGRFRITKYFGELETIHVLGKDVVAEIQEMLSELRRSHPRPHHQHRRPSMYTGMA